MPKFGSASSTRLATCHIDLQVIFNEVVKTVDCSILCGYRAKEAQEKAFIEGLPQAYLLGHP